MSLRLLCSFSTILWANLLFSLNSPVYLVERRPILLIFVVINIIFKGNPSFFNEVVHICQVWTAIFENFLHCWVFLNTQSIHRGLLVLDWFWFIKKRLFLKLIFHYNVEDFVWFPVMVKFSAVIKIFRLLIMWVTRKFHRTLNPGAFLDVFPEKIIQIHNICALSSICILVGFPHLLHISIMNTEHSRGIFVVIFWRCGFTRKILNFMILNFGF